MSGHHTLTPRFYGGSKGSLIEWFRFLLYYFVIISSHFLNLYTPITMSNSWKTMHRNIGLKLHRVVLGYILRIFDFRLTWFQSRHYGTCWEDLFGWRSGETQYQTAIERACHSPEDLWNWSREVLKYVRLVNCVHDNRNLCKIFWRVHIAMILNWCKKP